MVLVAGLLLFPKPRNEKRRRPGSRFLIDYIRPAHARLLTQLGPRRTLPRQDLFPTRLAPPSLVKATGGMARFGVLSLLRERGPPIANSPFRVFSVSGDRVILLSGPLARPAAVIARRVHEGGDYERLQMLGFETSSPPFPSVARCLETHAFGTAPLVRNPSRSVRGLLVKICLAYCAGVR